LPEKIVFRLTLGLTTARLRSSRLTVAAGLALPALLAWLGFRDSYETMAGAFLLLFPYVFLLGSRDAALDELDSGALENVLFLDGRFRTYLRQKVLCLTAATGAYALGLFILISLWGLAAGRFRPVMILQFVMGLLAGAYYAGAAAALGVFLRSGANVMALLVAQAGAAAALLASAAGRSGFIDNLTSGRFPDAASRLRLSALLAAFPNLIVLGSFFRGAPVVAAGLVLALLARRLRLRRLEVRR